MVKMTIEELKRKLADGWRVWSNGEYDIDGEVTIVRPWGNGGLEFMEVQYA